MSTGHTLSLLVVFAATVVLALIIRNRLRARGLPGAPALLLLLACLLIVPTFSSSAQNDDRQTPKTDGSAPEALIVTHGPIVGAVTSNSAVVFVRASGSANLRVYYDTVPVYGPSSAKVSASALAAATNDFVARLGLTGLRPETTYYYWVGFASNPPDTSHVYQFRTFPTPVTPRDFTFAVFADLSTGDSHDAPAYARAASFDPAFVGQIGDFRHQNPGALPAPIQISNWWTQNKQAIGGTLMGEDFSNNIGDRFAFFHVWDDHDFGKDDSDMTMPNKAMAMQAFKQYFPTYALPAGGQGIWQKFAYGQEAAFFVLDLRYQRSPDNQIDDSNKSMLGATQKQWLKDGLIASQQLGITWKFIISSSVWNPRGKYTDSWKVFSTEQQELINFIKDNGIKNVIVISGDFHTGGAIDGGEGTISCSLGWCIPELNVPHTNIFQQEYCTQVPSSSDCGTWSVGLAYAQTSGVSNAGFGLIHVTPGAVTLQAIRGSDGFVNVEYTVYAMP